MLCPVWLLAVVVVGVATGAEGQCWEAARCQDLSSEDNILECIQLCHSDLTAESPIFPGDGHLQPPSPPDTEALYPSQLQAGPRPAKRSYSMEHFRWSKPVGTKRRPIKAYINGMEKESAKEESTKDFSGEMRRELGNGLEEGGAEAELGGLLGPQEKKDGYKMNHFRWSGPPAAKRYGGFMKSWDERGQKPLATLFKNVINKNGQQKREE